MEALTGYYTLASVGFLSHGALAPSRGMVLLRIGVFPHLGGRAFRLVFVVVFVAPPASSICIVRRPQEVSRICLAALVGLRGFANPEGWVFVFANGFAPCPILSRLASQLASVEVF